jgi:hypothetical protein
MVDLIFKLKDSLQEVKKYKFLIDGDSTFIKIKIPIIGYSGKPNTSSIS